MAKVTRILFLLITSAQLFSCAYTIRHTILTTAQIEGPSVHKHGHYETTMLYHIHRQGKDAVIKSTLHFLKPSEEYNIAQGDKFDLQYDSANPYLNVLMPYRPVLSNQIDTSVAQITNIEQIGSWGEKKLYVQMKFQTKDSAKQINTGIAIFRPDTMAYTDFHTGNSLLLKYERQHPAKVYLVYVYPLSPYK